MAMASTNITSVDDHFKPVVARLFCRLPGVGFSDVVCNALIKYTVTLFYFKLAITIPLFIIMIQHTTSWRWHRSILPQLTTISNTTPKNHATKPPAVDRVSQWLQFEAGFDHTGQQLTIYGQRGRWLQHKSKEIGANVPCVGVGVALR